MINNLKLGIKMFKYGSGLVGMIVCGCIFLALGLLMDFGYNVLGIAGSPGGVFIMLVAMYPVQIIYTLSVSNFIASSPVRRRMQTSVPATICCCNMIVLYIVSLLCKSIMLKGHQEDIGTACAEMVSLAGFAVLIMLYLAVGYKYFWTSVAAGILVCFYTVGRLDKINNSWFGIFDNSARSLALALFIGLVLIVLGGFGQYGLSLLVYKAPMSKYSQSAAVRKEM